MAATVPAKKSSVGLADEKVLVLDFGSQYAQLIARRVREQNVYCEIVRHDISAARVREIAPKGLILSGGPASVYQASAPKCDPQLFELGIPVLGICYGMQLACEALGGQVHSAGARIRPGAMLDHHHEQFVFGRAVRNRSVDEPRRPGKQPVERIRAVGADGHVPHYGRETPAIAGLWVAVSSGSDAHAGRQDDPGKFCEQSLRLPRHVEVGRLRGANDSSVARACGQSSE